MPDVGAQLEAALTDAGTLLVWAEKYRHDDPTLLVSWRRRLLTHGDLARRLARAGELDASAARELLTKVATVNRAVRRDIQEIRGGAIYRQAVAALACRDEAALRGLLPRIFADLRSDARPAVLYWTPAWQRRGRPLEADALGEVLRALETTGLPAASDDLTPGVDPELPGVLLSTTPPLGAPLAIRYGALVLPETCLFSGDDQVLFPGESLRLPFDVVLASADDPLDEWVADPGVYLAALEATCRRLGLTVEKMPTPAASS